MHATVESVHIHFHGSTNNVTARAKRKPDLAREVMLAEGKKTPPSIYLSLDSLSHFTKKVKVYKTLYIEGGL